MRIPSLSPSMGSISLLLLRKAYTNPEHFRPYSAKLLGPSLPIRFIKYVLSLAWDYPSSSTL